MTSDRELRQRIWEIAEQRFTGYFSIKHLYYYYELEYGDYDSRKRISDIVQGLEADGRFTRKTVHTQKPKQLYKKAEIEEQFTSGTLEEATPEIEDILKLES